jgi:hypothetical protein
MSGENWDLGQWRPVGFVKSPVEKGKRRMWNRCFLKTTELNWQPFWGGGFLPG